MVRIALSIFILFISTVSHAASFNCAKATTKVEKIVCSNDEISNLDDLLGDLYESTYDEFIRKNYMPSIITDLVKDQKHWLKFIRNTCKDANCVKRAYESRINDIGLQVDENDVSTRSLSLKCDYSANTSSPIQQVSIGSAVYSRGETATIKEFSADSKQPQHVEFVVKPGQVAECVYPSGFRVRAKVGEGMAYPYGMCGADPEVFLSLWVNKKKIASQVWFAGHCIEDSGNNRPVTYKISPAPCNSANHHADTSKNTNNIPSGNTDICADSKYLNQYPVDTLEYADNKAKMPKVGEYELVTGTDKVCNAVMGEINKGSFSVYDSPISNYGEIEQPAWNDLQDSFPQALLDGGYGQESTYDYDNDGKLDKVYKLSYSTHYMDATVLLVQPGSSSKLLEPIAPLQNKATMSIPCQVTGQPSEFGECPPYSQKGDGAGFEIGGKSNEISVYFVSRYSHVKPFFYNKASYVLIRNGLARSANYSAILKPLPLRKVEQTCLVRQVVENF